MLNSRWAMTAAHCLKSHINNYRNEKTLFAVTAGTIYERPNQQNTTRRTVYSKKFYSHEDHYTNPTVPSGFNYDIGLVLLVSKMYDVPYQNIEPALLPPRHHPRQMVLGERWSCRISGWCRVDAMGTSPDILKVQTGVTVTAVTDSIFGHCSAGVKNPEDSR